MQFYPGKYYILTRRGTDTNGFLRGTVLKYICVTGQLGPDNYMCLFKAGKYEIVLDQAALKGFDLADFVVKDQHKFLKPYGQQPSKEEFRGDLGGGPGGQPLLNSLFGE